MSVKKDKMTEAGEASGGIVSPLYEEGTKGGNSESPSPEEYDFMPRDPLGYLPAGAKEKGKGK